jgi:hypothetical protein
VDIKEKLLRFAEEFSHTDYETAETELAKAFPEHRTRVTIDKDTRATRLSVDDYTVEIPERNKDRRVVYKDGGVYINGKFTSKEALDEVMNWIPSEEVSRKISEQMAREMSERRSEDKIWFVNEEVWSEKLLGYCVSKEEQKVIHDVFVRARDQVPRDERGGWIDF